MKPLQALLIVSLAANLILAAFAFFARPTPAHEKAASVSASAALEPKASPPDVATANPPANTWADLQSDDLATLVHRLRAAGFPPLMVHAVIAFILGERLAVSERAIFAGERDAPYWRAASASSEEDPFRAYGRLVDERDALLRKLLGAGAHVDEMARAAQRRRYGDLPVDKLARLQEIIADYAALRHQVRPGGRPKFPEEKDKLAALDREMRADLEKLLTPQELENYDLRSSPTASRLRMELQTFQATEAEYRALFPLFRRLDEQFPILYASGGPDDPAARAQAQQHLQSAIGTALGPERYADYQQASNPEHAAFNRLVARLDLPLAAARSIVTIQSEVMMRADAARADPQLDAAARDAELAALRRFAQTKITGILGARGFDLYPQHGGQWLKTLPPPTPTMPPKN